MYLVAPLAEGSIGVGQLNHTLYCVSCTCTPTFEDKEATHATWYRARELNRLFWSGLMLSPLHVLVWDHLSSQDDIVH